MYCISTSPSIIINSRNVFLLSEVMGSFLEFVNPRILHLILFNATHSRSRSIDARTPFQRQSGLRNQNEPGFLSAKKLSTRQHFPKLYEECFCPYSNNNPGVSAFIFISMQKRQQSEEIRRMLHQYLLSL